MEKQDTKELHDRRFGMDGRVAVVTGSSHGIGLACAQRLASTGCEVVLVSRTAGALAEAEQSLASKGLRVRSAACDVCDLDAFASLIGGLELVDVLVNNAARHRRPPY